VRCTDCRLVYQESKLSHDSLERIYNSAFYWQAGEGSQLGGRIGYADYLGDNGARIHQARGRVRLVSRFLPSGSKILDVACATGFFVKVARDAGLEARGVDLSAEMARAGQESTGSRSR